MGRVGDFSSWQVPLLMQQSLRTRANGLFVVHLPGTARLRLDVGHVWRCCLRKSCREARAEMLERVFFPRLLFALGAGLKLLLWHSLRCLVH